MEVITYFRDIQILMLISDFDGVNPEDDRAAQLRNPAHALWTRRERVQPKRRWQVQWIANVSITGTTIAA